MIKPEDVTIIIPHLGADEQQRYSLGQCLQSLQETVPDIKKIVAFNGQSGFAFGDAAFKLEINDFVVIPDQGQCKAVNAAVATTNTPWIFITNDDMIYPTEWWERLTDVPYPPLTECVSPKLIEPRPGAPTFNVFFAGGAGGDFDKQKFLNYVNECNQKDNMGVVTGFNLPFLIKRELWDTIGGYDINYDPWGSNSDSDLEYKIKLAGVQPYQNTNCIVYHFSQTSGTFNPANDSYRFNNYAYFKEKWGFDRTDDGIWEANFTIPTKEEGRIFNPKWEGEYETSR